MNILIKTGEFKDQPWKLNGDKLTNGFYKIKELPLSELVLLNKKEEISKLLYVEFEFSNGITFTASMLKNVYAKIYEAFLQHKDSSKLNSNTIDDSWKEGKPIVKTSKMNIVFAVVGGLFLISVFNGNNTTKSKDYLTYDKARLCKAYIGSMFGKSTSIIQNYKNEDNLTYVRYVREEDKQTFSYVCEINNNTMIWAAYLNDTQKWGRWRTEDQVDLNYNKEKNTTSFTRVDTGQTIGVRF